VSHYKC